MQNDALYGLYEIAFDRMDSIVIEGTGDATKCAPLVEHYLLGDGDDEYIDHIELKRLEDEIRKEKPWFNKAALSFMHDLGLNMKESEKKATHSELVK
jgi:hypothetical protein